MPRPAASSRIPTARSRPAWFPIIRWKEVLRILLYKMEGSSTDSFGSNSGTDTNMSYPTNSKKVGTYGAYFSGSGYIVKSSPSGLPSGSTSRSVAVWVRTNSATQQILDRGNPVGGNGTDFNLLMISNTFQLFAGGDGSWLLNSGTNIADGNWHLVIATYDNPSATNTLTINKKLKLLGL